MSGLGLSGCPKKFLEELKGDGVEKLCQHTSVFHATLAAGDFLFTPSNFIVLERVGTTEDTFGVKVSTVLPRDQKGFAPYASKAALTSTPEAHVSKKVVAVAEAWQKAWAAQQQPPTS